MLRRSILLVVLRSDQERDMRPALRIAQTLANCRAVMAHYSLPRLEVRATLVDRTVFWAHKSDFRAHLLALCGKFERWPFIRNHGTTAIFGWRERVAWCSCQIVEHEHGLIEIDFDLANPDYGALPALVHGIECLWPGKTDSFKVMRGLRGRGIKVIDIREGGDNAPHKAKSAGQ
jgi:hypothetical protein